jgi:hypothetical protein
MATEFKLRGSCNGILEYETKVIPVLRVLCPECGQGLESSYSHVFPGNPVDERVTKEEYYTALHIMPSPCTNPVCVRRRISSQLTDVVRDVLEFLKK